jgi:hypothetical protein
VAAVAATLLRQGLETPASNRHMQPPAAAPAQGIQVVEVQPAPDPLQFNIRDAAAVIAAAPGAASMLPFRQALSKAPTSSQRPRGYSSIRVSGLMRHAERAAAIWRRMIIELRRFGSPGVRCIRM